MIVSELTLQRFAFGLEVSVKLFGSRFDLADCLIEQVFVGADRLNLFDNKAFDLACGHRWRWALGPALLHRGAAYVIAVSLVAFAAVRVRHRASARLAPNQTLEQRAVLIANTGAAGLAIPFELPLNAAEQVQWNDRVVFAFVRFVFVADLADVSDIGQQLVNRILGEFASATMVAFLGNPLFGGPTSPAEFFDDWQQ